MILVTGADGFIGSHLVETLAFPFRFLEKARIL
ncbi:NAD-dependent epimerase/dehydratase family protein [Leptospira santarosai]